MKSTFIGILALVAATHLPASAQTLNVGMKAEPMSMDPQFRAIVTDLQVSQHIFDGLVGFDPKLNLVPGLALSWKAINPTTWEFALRPNVKFSDGSPFTAADVVFSYERLLKVPNSPSPMSVFLRDVARMEAVDALTLRVTTSAPAPTLPSRMRALYILSKSAAAGPAPEGKTTSQLNAGDGLVGTGPYKFVSWSRGAEIVLEKNPLYWGASPAWDKVVIRFLVNPAARLSALLSGGVDIMEDPSPDDIPRLLKDPKLRVESTPTVRVMYIGLDQFSPSLPGLKGNPLKDLRVRQALSLAIDRKALMERVMEGVADPTADVVAPVMEGARTDAKLPAYEPERAKKLLAEAGYPSGFTLTFGASNGRYINDAKVAQAIASMWSRVGIDVKLDTAATPIFFKNLVAYAYPSHLGSWGDTETIGRLRAMLLPRSAASGDGATNYGQYGNPAVTALVNQAALTMDHDARAALMRKATAQAVDADLGVIPLYFEKTAWAMRKDLNYPARVDQYFLSQNVRPAAKP